MKFHNEISWNFTRETFVSKYEISRSTVCTGNRVFGGCIFDSFLLTFFYQVSVAQPSSSYVPLFFIFLPPFSSFYEIMKATTVKHHKPKSGARLHFTEYADEGGVLKARCNLCPSGPGKKPWDTVVNATRMAKHLKERHRLEVKPEDTETEPEVEPRSPPQPLISSSPSPFSAPSSPSSSFVNPSPGPAHSSAAEPSQPALKKPKKSL